MLMFNGDLLVLVVWPLLCLESRMAIFLDGTRIWIVFPVWSFLFQAGGRIWPYATRIFQHVDKSTEMTAWSSFCGPSRVDEKNDTYEFPGRVIAANQ